MRRPDSVRSPPRAPRVLSILGNFVLGSRKIPAPQELARHVKSKEGVYPMAALLAAAGAVLGIMPNLCKLGSGQGGHNSAAGGRWQVRDP